MPLVAIAVLGAPQAQARQSDIPPPKAIIADPNGVDLLSGDVSFAQLDNSIGPKGPGSLSSSRIVRGSGANIVALNSYIRITDDGTNTNTTLVLDGRSQLFSGAAPFASPEGDSVGRFSGTSSTGIIYTAPDGTKAVFQWVILGSHAPAATGRLKSITYPTGETITYNNVQTSAISTILRAESSLGYVLFTDYSGLEPWVSNRTTGNCTDTDCGGTKYLSQYTLGRANQISSTGNPGASSYTVTVTSAAGDVQRVYTMTGSSVVSSDTGYRVSSVTGSGGTWSYAYAFTQDSVFPDAVDGIFQTTVTDPNGVKRVIRSRLSSGHVLTDRQGVTAQDALGRLTTYGYQYDANNPTRLGFGRVSRVSLPSGDAYEYTYDGYANITSRKHYPKNFGNGASLSPTEATAGYPADCRTTTSAPVTKICDKPDWIRDENGNQTDFTYDLDHGGGVATVTRPAPTAGGIRPQTRYTYTQVQAYLFKEVNGVSGYEFGLPAWRVASTSTCRTKATCAGEADELVTEYAYESGSSYTHNARLISVTTRAGNASASSNAYAKTTYSYNDRGDVTLVDGPLPGDGDLTQTHYDLSRWVVGTVGANPTGAGYRATKNVYRADGQVQTAYTGLVADRLGPTFVNNFQVKSSVTNDYDSYGRVSALASANASGATYALTETSYDTFGRVDCVAVRMDASKFANRPGACSGGDNGADKDPDRITKTRYTKYGEVESVQSGLNVNAIYDRRATYTANGKVETEKDGVDNLTSYVYDDLDRLSTVAYPTVAKNTSASNFSDTEVYGYDPVGNVTSRTLRGGGAITSEYDNLNRLKKRTTPNKDVSGQVYNYLYDNFDNPVSNDDGVRIIARDYDALGRMTQESNGSGGLGSVSYEYDQAGRRTKLTWPDGFFVSYEYFSDSALRYIRRAGSDTLVTFAYDELGRRSSLSRGNNVTTTYDYVTTAYDPNAKNLLLKSIAHTLPPVGGSPSVDNVTFGLAYNMAGQVTRRTITNPSYTWAAPNVTGGYDINGLNQMTTARGASIAYDARGNLTNDSVNVWKYDAENKLRGSQPGASLTYDAAGRLTQTITAPGAPSGTTTRYLYDGANLIGEYDASGTLLRRYVHGPGTDEPLVQYNGAGTIAEWLLADHQGSIVAATNGTGLIATATINNTTVRKLLTYGEYGQPGGGNMGLFQYTGQVYLSDLALYHYKARAYSPTFGRFLQTDPTGYGDGLNWYAYVGNDPLNRSDPTGLEAVDPVTITASRGNCGRACYESLAGERILPNGKTPYQQCGWSCTYQQGQQDMLADQAAEDNWYWAIPALAPEMAVDAIGVVGAIGARAAAISVRGLAVTFGRDANQVYHTFRHVEGIGMSASSVRRAVTSDLAKVAKSVAPGTDVRRTIAIGSIRVEYRAFKLPNGSMNVGSIFAVGSKR